MYLWYWSVSLHKITNARRFNSCALCSYSCSRLEKILRDPLWAKETRPADIKVLPKPVHHYLLSFFKKGIYLERLDHTHEVPECSVVVSHEVVDYGPPKWQTVSLHLKERRVQKKVEHIFPPRFPCILITTQAG